MDIVKLNANYISCIRDQYVVAIGNFDGIHQAHRHVLRMAKKLAKDNNIKFGVMTFDVTPRKVVNKIDNYYVLRSFKQKKEILEELGVDTLFLFEFDEKLKNMSATDFIDKFIINNSVKFLVCGFDYHFGKDKSGDVDLLSSYSQFKTVILSQEMINNQKIGSTLIHELILNGEIQKANDLLVKPYAMTGIVVTGNQKGRLIGYPTANIKLDTNYRIPKNGVYATQTIIDGVTYNSMTNVGHNPTFNYNSNVRIETNIFDLNEDLYGKEIEVIFKKYIRNEKVFDSVQQLVDQMARDKQKVIDYFND